MSETGITRKMDELGRFVLPAETRRKLGIDTGCPLEVFFEDNQIILQKAIPQRDFLSLAQKMALALSSRISSDIYVINYNDVLIQTTPKPLAKDIVNTLLYEVRKQNTPTGLIYTEQDWAQSYYAVPLNTHNFYGLLIAVFDKHHASEKEYLATTLTADLLILLLN